MFNISLLIGLKNNLEYNKHFYNTTRQIYPTVEICFVSYGSTDGTHEWLDSLNDANVKYYYSQEPKTFSDTFNKAAEIATNKYVVYLHNDIVLAPMFLENIVKHVSINTIVSYTTIEPPIFAGHERPGKIIKDFGYDLNTFKSHAFYNEVTILQDDVYRDKIEDGATFFMCIPRNVLLNIGGLDNLFNPMFCEDDDLLRRFALLGLEMITSLDAICYHFVSKTSRFSKEYENTTSAVEHNSKRNFIRKWHSIENSNKVNDIIKYNTTFILYNATLQSIIALEPWCDKLYIDNVNVIQQYIVFEQRYTKYNLTKKIVELKNLPTDDDIIVTININVFDNTQYKYIQQLSKIIKESGEIGSFELDTMKITINKLSQIENTLITNTYEY
jgi:GT2 family glycosyltransferase